MERVCFLARIRPGRLEEYRERHTRVWPEMREALRDAGWSNYSLFLSDDGLLVGYLETDDYQAALDAMAATDVNTRWQAEMSEYFMNTTAVAGAAGAGGDTDSGPPDRSFLRIAEIFHLD